MERVDFGSGVTLSRMIYGMWRLADAPGGAAQVRAKIDACLAQGITSFDQADIYGDYESETLFGEALESAPGLRDKIEIITKCGLMIRSEKYPARAVKHYDTSARHIKTAVENSLKKMRVEQIDMLLIHRPDPLMDPDETGGALDDLVAFGKVRAVGVCNFLPHDFALLQGSMETPLVTNQIELSLLRHEPIVSGELAFLQERRIAPIVWSPLAGGALFASAPPKLMSALARVAAEQGVDVPAVAVAWLMRHPAGVLPVVGTSDLSRIARLSEALRVRIDRETWFELYEAARGHEAA